MGRYWLAANGKYEFLADKIDRDLRHGMEFIMRVRPFYTRHDLLRLNYLTFFQLLEECEQEQREINAKMKEGAK